VNELLPHGDHDIDLRDTEGCGNQLSMTTLAGTSPYLSL